MKYIPTKVCNAHFKLLNKYTNTLKLIIQCSKFLSPGFFSVSYFHFHLAAETMMSLITVVLPPCNKMQTLATLHMYIHTCVPLRVSTGILQKGTMNLLQSQKILV